MSEERKFKIISIPDEITLNKNNIYEFEVIPSDEFLTKTEYDGIPMRLVNLQKVEQLEKELKETNDLLHKANDEVVSYCNRCIELENIRKEAITYILAHCEIIRHKKENVDEVGNVNGGDLLNILNKGSESDVKDK